MKNFLMHFEVASLYDDYVLLSPLTQPICSLVYKYVYNWMFWLNGFMQRLEDQLLLCTLFYSSLIHHTFYHTFPHIKTHTQFHLKDTKCTHNIKNCMNLFLRWTITFNFFFRKFKKSFLLKCKMFIIIKWIE